MTAATLTLSAQESTQTALDAFRVVGSKMNRTQLEYIRRTLQIACAKLLRAESILSGALQPESGERQ